MNRRPILALVARLAVLAMVVQSGTIWVCSHWFWTAIQRHYLPAYIWCSLPVIAPANIEVRLIWKTGPHRKRELVSDDDAVESEDGTGMALSPGAIDTGWTGLTEGLPRRVSTAKLGPGLADLAFDGESLWDFLLLPEACGMAVFLLALSGWLFLKWWCRALLAEFAWRRRLSSWQEVLPSLIEECATLARRFCSGLAALHRSAARRIETHETAPSTTTDHAEPIAKAQSLAFPLFGVHNGTGEGYRWSEQDEIE
ncbi:MAG TPA: hypothetical protein VG225_08400 [Terracidiphilus sp.]|jgi:hypothetical protein|nr:hypothetical protein [Terracidiphilus sp.]